MNQDISDEILNAFVDGELDREETEEIFNRLQTDQALASRICLLRSMKGMTRLAFNHPPPSERTAATLRRDRILGRAVAAVLAVMVGFGGGWWASGGRPATEPEPVFAGLQPMSLSKAVETGKVVIHVDTDDAVKLKTVLDSIEKLMAEAKARGRDPELEVIANSNGLDLLRAGVSPFPNRVSDLALRYHHLSFVACGQTVARFQREGKTVELLPEVQMVPSAVGQIVNRLQQGWAYLKI